MCALRTPAAFVPDARQGRLPNMALMAKPREFRVVIDIGFRQTLSAACVGSVSRLLDTQTQTLMGAYHAPPVCAQNRIGRAHPFMPLCAPKTITMIHTLIGVGKARPTLRGRCPLQGEQAVRQAAYASPTPVSSEYAFGRRFPFMALRTTKTMPPPDAAIVFAQAHPASGRGGLLQSFQTIPTQQLHAVRRVGTLPAPAAQQDTLPLRTPRMA